jgi:hypothetical protein
MLLRCANTRREALPAIIPPGHDPLTARAAYTTGEVDMSTDQKLEVVTLPVSDVDRAKDFYVGLGWRLDADIVRGENFRAIQVTPPHSQCSIAFGSDPDGNAWQLQEIRERLPGREWED